MHYFVAKSNRTCSSGMPSAHTSLFIREPTDMTSSSQSSLDDEVTNESSTIFPTNGMLISTEGLERGESSKGKSIRRNCVHK